MVLVILINVLGFQCYQIHPIELQECQKFFLLSAKFGRTDIRKHFFIQRVVSPWNDLPFDIKTAPTSNTVKSRYENM